MSARQRSSIRRRFLLVVLCGAVIPLALAGAWLARSSVRSAEGLLRMQLDTSLTTISAKMDRRWDYRRGDLLMLAGNEVIVHTMRADQVTISAADSAYMNRMYESLSAAIPTMRFSTTNGSVRWQFGAATESSADSAARGRMQSQTPDARVPVSVPIRTDQGLPVGTMDAEVRLSALLPLDSIPILLNDAQLTVTDRRSGRALTLPGLGDAPNDVSNYAVNGQGWIAQHRTTANALLMVTAAAPTRAYVAPFEQSARIGLVVFFAVTVMVLVLTAFFTARITHSLERLAGAADAVAAGDLSRAVDADGDDEVGQLGRSFNTMIESLRRTLQQLSQREALAAVGEFATTLSHEVRNGLTAVRIDLERVEESGPAAPESPALVARTLRNVHRLNSTVTGALAVARSGRTELHAVNLRAVLSAAAAAAESAFAGSGSSLTTLINGSAEYFVRGDSVALEQLFLNVLLNAGQAMTQGGSATLELTMAGNECIVSLCDSGPGLSADQLSRVGQAFQTSKRDGTGLGVSIARKIAEAHGGQLLLQNGPRGGLVVRVTLPGYIHGAATLVQMENVRPGSSCPSAT